MTKTFINYTRRSNEKITPFESFQRVYDLDPIHFMEFEFRNAEKLPLVNKAREEIKKFSDGGDIHKIDCYEYSNGFGGDSDEEIDQDWDEVYTHSGNANNTEEIDTTQTFTTNGVTFQIYETDNYIAVSMTYANIEVRSELLTIAEEIKKVATKKKNSKSKIHLICYSSKFYLKQFPINKINVDVTKCYNEDFAVVHEHILESLKSEKSGIILLHGIPGSGKTTYLRHLINNLEKKVIFLPPDLAHRISQPEFVQFLIEQKDSILLIEDAENVLTTREAGGNQAVANLLNVSDGILGDALNIRVICTFNTELTKIDDALKRPGRMIAEYKFDKLNEKKTNALLTSLYGPDKYPEKEMTLAEIYTFKKPRHVTKDVEKVFGFT